LISRVIKIHQDSYLIDGNSVLVRGQEGVKVIENIWAEEEEQDELIEITYEDGKHILSLNTKFHVSIDFAN
jgi:hypothetical protein